MDEDIFEEMTDEEIKEQLEEEEADRIISSYEWQEKEYLDCYLPA